MKKVNGYNPNDGDWFWVKYTPEGEAKPFGKPAGRIGCHGTRAGYAVFIIIDRGHVLLVIHPIIQLSAVVLTLYVFCLGVQRFRSLQLHQKTLFRWKRHVLLGKIAKKRTALPLIHGLSNLVLLILALTQVVTGWRVYMLLVLVR